MGQPRDSPAASPPLGEAKQHDRETGPMAVRPHAFAFERFPQLPGRPQLAVTVRHLAPTPRPDPLPLFDHQFLPQSRQPIWLVDPVTPHPASKALQPSPET
jgi:hypothetical protein